MTTRHSGSDIENLVGRNSITWEVVWAMRWMGTWFFRFLWVYRYLLSPSKINSNHFLNIFERHPPLQKGSKTQNCEKVYKGDIVIKNRLTRTIILTLMIDYLTTNPKMSFRRGMSRVKILKKWHWGIEILVYEKKTHLKQCCRIQYYFLDLKIFKYFDWMELENSRDFKVLDYSTG